MWVSAGLHPFLEALRGESMSLFFQAVGRIQSLAAEGLRSPFPSWLAAEGHSQLGDASHVHFLLM